MSKFGLLDKTENKPSDLDKCGRYSDTIRGCHYHAGEPGVNQIIKYLKGMPGYTEVEEYQYRQDSLRYINLPTYTIFAYFCV